jgi:hypothetical protein
MHQSPGGWETLRTQRGGTLDEMPYIGERELTEPTSRRQTGHQVRDGGTIPQSHLWSIIVPVWKNYRDWNAGKPEEKKIHWQAKSGIQLKDKFRGLTLLLWLRSTHKKGSIMTSIQETQQAAERVRCRFLHPTNGQKQLTPDAEIGKAKRSWGEGWSCRRTRCLT